MSSTMKMVTRMGTRCQGKVY